MRFLLLEDSYQDYLTALHELDASLEIVGGNDPEKVAGVAAECQIWLGQPDLVAKLLDQGLKPSWVQSTWAGIRPLLASGLTQDYVLTRAVGVFGQLMSEYVLGYLLAHERCLLERARKQADRLWEACTPGSLAGRRVLIVGAGDIGQDVARFLAPFGVELYGIARSPRALPGFLDVHGLEDLSREASKADYLINLLPDTSHTRDLYTLDLFKQLKPSALFVNAGRGTAIVDADLVTALEQKYLAGAVLDVFREEPLPKTHAFWSAPGLIITSHTAAVSSPPYIARLFLENLSRYRNGEALKGQVDFKQGY
ncbi:D-2-hydroxyacid dehydrogenase [Pseudomonas luteola]|uniref:D-2-hydroxyacid dehydrogenase n=1 Tax=Pseudomonas luteola TaxID=47886 RepID=UPI00123A383E|nr:MULTISPECIES: D-2-hydroxyacid dehydrogenase [Pseudomonas]MBA1249993.1 D-2-hydroxyacid dehydrogenase [Pseudomonas zeshuii]QEU28715.1 D-2-hydroxyacid dehydrogenase [Pseudomonas luteola]